MIHERENVIVADMSMKVSEYRGASKNPRAPRVKNVITVIIVVVLVIMYNEAAVNLTSIRSLA